VLEVALYDTYLSDITPLGAVVILKEEGKTQYFSRTYQKGEVYFNGDMFDAECIYFETGNIQITSLKGEDDKLNPFLQLLYQYQNKHQPRLMLRKFLQYLGLLSSFGIGTLSFYFLCRGEFKNFFIGFVIVFLLRLLYSESRNRL